MAYGGSQSSGSNRNCSRQPTYTRATAVQDQSPVCDLNRSSWQRWVLNPLNKARDRIHNLMVPGLIRFRCATTETLIPKFLGKKKFLTPKGMVLGGRAFGS